MFEQQQIINSISLNTGTKIFLISLLFLCQSLYSQNISNLQLIYELIDSSTAALTEKHDLNDNDYSFNFDSSPEYKFLYNHALASLSRYVSVSESNSGGNRFVKYIVEYAGVKYPKVFKAGFWGDFFILREVTLWGKYFITLADGTIQSNDFNYSITDSVEYDDVGSIETAGLSFTKSKLPPEPFFASLLEPLIAVSAIAITIILFFTVRSN
ncbi:MAG: hypothetical protein JW995_02815 [Melioribacteraceae bacterium]|nr:hypothetical protein [Melioribacteraceae bacterium]